MNYIFTMTLSGSCIFLAYILLRKILQGRLSENWYYSLMKMTALYFLIPIPYLKKFYMELFYAWRNAIGYGQRTIYNKEDWIVFTNENFIKLNDTIKVQGMLFVAGVIGTLLVGFGFVMTGCRQRKNLDDCCIKDAQEMEVQLRERIRKQYNVRKNVEFRYYGNGRSPFTIGFFKPLIFYDYAVSTEEKEMLLAHELIHIRRRDIFWRLFSIFIATMHWFNPLAWWFKRELERTCEFSCDEQVVANKDMDYCERYAKILIKYTTIQEGDALTAGFSKEAEAVNKRMKKILIKTKKVPKVVAKIIMIVMVMMNSLTAFAYNDVKIASGEAIMEESFFENDFALIPTGDELVWTESIFTQDYVLQYETQFIDVEGNVYEIYEGAETYATCNHQYVDGILQQHIKNSDGSCKVFNYSALYCKLCKNIAEKEYLSSTEFATCPH